MEHSCPYAARSDDGIYILTDLHSTNGTFLNGVEEKTAFLVGGTTEYGGKYPESGDPPGNGTVFCFTPAGSFKTLHTFRRRVPGKFTAPGRIKQMQDWAEQERAAGRDHPEMTDGRAPISGLIEATDGRTYGVTPTGGIQDYGTVFRVDPKAFSETATQATK